MKKYAITEVFHTLQGEGKNVGKPFVFVRFSGCNLWNGSPKDRDKFDAPCAKWCDTDFLVKEKYTLDELMKLIESTAKKNNCSNILLTGGEPTKQIDRAFMSVLRTRFDYLAIETNGTVPSDFIRESFFDMVTMAPKLGTSYQEMMSFAGEIKLVYPPVLNSEQTWLDEVIQEFEGVTFNLYVQPMDIPMYNLLGITTLKKGDYHVDPVYDTMYKNHLQKCLEFIKKHPKWSLSAQVHKYLNLP
jgi:organic radical activating enzyme